MDVEAAMGMAMLKTATKNKSRMVKPPDPRERSKNSDLSLNFRNSDLNRPWVCRIKLSTIQRKGRNCVGSVWRISASLSLNKSKL